MASPRTVHLPDQLDTLLERVANASGESPEAILITWIEHPISTPSVDGIEALIDEIQTYNLIQLWTVVYRQLPLEVEARHQAIVEKHEAGLELTPQEKADWDASVELAQVYSTLRAQALRVLKTRGENIDVYLNRELD